MKKTKFYELLAKARHDEATLVFVIDKIMPMKTIKDENFADKLAKEKN